MIKMNGYQEKDSNYIKSELMKGKIAAILSIDSSSPQPDLPNIKSKHRLLLLRQINIRFCVWPWRKPSRLLKTVEFPISIKIISVQELPDLPGREYTMIDFILPGMLGFSLLSAAVFGVAFVFFNLRQTLVLKRFYRHTHQPEKYCFWRGLEQGMFSVDGFCRDHPGRPFFLSFHSGEGIGHFPGNDGTEFPWAGRFYGIWIYHQQRCKK